MPSWNQDILNFSARTILIHVSLVTSTTKDVVLYLEFFILSCGIPVVYLIAVYKGDIS
jgi:hypothetical protein